jgi:hypothetical protein
LSLTHDTGLSNGRLILSRLKLEADFLEFKGIHWKRPIDKVFLDNIKKLKLMGLE